MNISAKTAFIILAVVVFIGEFSKDPENQRPKLKLAPAAPTLPPLADVGPEGRGVVGPGLGNDDIILIEEDVKSGRSQYTGTAFSIDNSGIWITARHVTEGCDQLLLARPFRRPLRVEAHVEHNNADVSIIKTKGGYAALPIDFSPPSYNQEGFHFGFPRGNPGDVYSRLIGRRTMKTTGAHNYKETVHVWAEKIRVPDSNESLGGISGGPILNAAGSVVGIHVAGSIRRGRSFSSQPKNINDLLKQNNVTLSPPNNQIDKSELNLSDFSKVGNKLREGLTVALVVCRTS
ncbi:MAG: trypsin-like peptidase domain-containing protein [Emcibacteraceae bacterium]|nr:trypsin-like peptidase domain-containing protein [Emcibacteraceae bacterium]